MTVLAGCGSSEDSEPTGAGGTAGTDAGAEMDASAGSGGTGGGAGASGGSSGAAGAAGQGASSGASGRGEDRWRWWWQGAVGHRRNFGSAARRISAWTTATACWITIAATAECIRDSCPPGHGCAVDSCAETNCEEYGVSRSFCASGNCLIEKTDCDPSHVTCGEPPPQCRSLTRPRVVDGCWGPCVPVGFCAGFVYRRCEECAAGDACVSWSSCLGDACQTARSCEPMPSGCGAELTCACGGEELCAAWPGTSCYERAGRAYCCEGASEACRLAGG